MTEQCKIYLDPWDKTDLEGTAMLIDRIPDLEERTYRGVTCQRWLVRFLPDQDNAKRWLDYTDAEPYEYPYLTPHVYTLGSPYIALNDASPALTFLSAHSIQLTWETGNPIVAYLTPHAGFYRGFSIIYSTFAASEGADLPVLSIRSNFVQLDAQTLSYATTPGGPYAHRAIRTPPKPINISTRITAAITGPQPAGESIALSNIIVSLYCAWD